MNKRGNTSLIIVLVLGVVAFLFFSGSFDDNNSDGDGINFCGGGWVVVDTFTGDASLMACSGSGNVCECTFGSGAGSINLDDLGDLVNSCAFDVIKGQGISGVMSELCVDVFQTTSGIDLFQ